MEQLWAPWRLAYVAAPKDRPHSTASGEDCFICRAATGGGDDRADLVALRTPLSVVILNRYPYNNGHLLICPRAHAGRLDQLDTDQLLDLQQLLVRLTGVLERRLSPDGFNIGLNLGRAAGAGVPGHLHWHLVPRWVGDTNFMPVVADTKVISQSLEALYDVVTGELGSGGPRAGPAPSPSAV